MIAWELSTPAAVLGLSTGVMYGLLAVGLVLVYRATRVLDVAHGELGAFAASMLGLVVMRWHLPYWVAFVLALLAGAATAAMTELIVVRRLRDVPRLVSVVALLGVGQFLVGFALAVNPASRAGIRYPVPPFLPTFHVGTFKVTSATTAMLLLGPLAVGMLALFLRRARLGRELLAAAANPEAARLAGVPAARMGTLAWAIAGALSAMTAVLVTPTRGVVAASTFGPSLLLRALLCAVIARFDRLPVAFVAALVLGVVEQEVQWNTSNDGIVEVMLLVAVVVGLVLQRAPLGREDDSGAWLAVRPLRPLAVVLRELPLVRRAPTVIAVAALVAGIVAPMVLTNATAYVVVSILAFSVIGLGVGVLSGLSGQLSLGMFAVAAVGAVVSVRVAASTGNFLLAFLAAVAAGAGASVVVGAAAVRSKGLLLAVTTLAFAGAVQRWALPHSWMIGTSREPGQPILAGFALDTGRSYLALAVAVTALAVMVAWNIRRSGIGRRLVAVRDNEPAARAFAVRAARTKLLGLAAAGSFAGLGGALYAHALPSIVPDTFAVGGSIDVVALTVIGGIGLLAGPVLGAFYTIGLPRFLPLDSAALAASSFGWLVLVMYLPGGLASLIGPVRDRLVAVVARRAGVDPALVHAGAPDLVGEHRAPLRLAVPSGANGGASTRSGGVVLAASGLRKAYGGVIAVDGVDLAIDAGTITGLIGPNGAGKTTLFELLAGSVPADAGRVVLDGHDVTTWSAERRALVGLGRTFQDATSFPTLTVRDAVLVALERRQPTGTALALVGIDRRRKERLARADELVGALGLGAWRDVPTGELSTGTRRICELACLLALEPSVVLLDEPTGGLAQREVEAMAGLLRRLRDELGLTVVMIEHDVPLVMAVADRVVAMAAGAVIADGDPAAVASDPEVVAAYLGTDPAALRRSDQG